MLAFSGYLRAYSPILDRRRVSADSESHARHYRTSVDVAHMGHRYRHLLDDRFVRCEEPIARSEI